MIRPSDRLLQKIANLSTRQYQETVFAIVNENTTIDVARDNNDISETTYVQRIECSRCCWGWEEVHNTRMKVGDRH